MNFFFVLLVAYISFFSGVFYSRYADHTKCPATITGGRSGDAIAEGKRSVAIAGNGGNTITGEVDLSEVCNNHTGAKYAVQNGFFDYKPPSNSTCSYSHGEGGGGYTPQTIVVNIPTKKYRNTQRDCK